uniref:Uncharacterized protein n=1 Tax=Rhizophora mucronata TaxID=61149 RepID=A0A2P2IHI7_RHIMU
MSLTLIPFFVFFLSFLFSLKYLATLCSFKIKLSL